jgi:hypothetical protein
MSFPSQRDVDALTNFEDDEFDALLSGGSSKFAPNKSPSTSSASAALSSSTKKTSSTRVRSSTVAVTDPSLSAPSKAQSSFKDTVSVGDGQGASPAPAPLTFGSTAFLSELQNRRKHVLHDNCMKAAGSDDEPDPPSGAADKLPRAAGANAPKPPSSQVATPSQEFVPKAVDSHAAQPVAAVQPVLIAAERPSDASSPDASACLRRLDRLPSTVEKCMKE